MAVLLQQKISTLKCTPSVAYPWAKAGFRLFVNTNLSPFSGQDWVEGLRGKHILFLFQLKFCRQSLPIPNGVDRCSVSEGTLIGLLIALHWKSPSGSNQWPLPRGTSGRDTEDCDVIRYVGKRNHTDSKSHKQVIRLVWELQEKHPCLLKFLMETFSQCWATQKAERERYSLSTRIGGKNGTELFNLLLHRH